MLEENVFEIKVTKISRVKREQSNWVKIREPYPNERELSQEAKEKDPQHDYRRIFAETEIKEEIYNQRVNDLDMAALVQVVNKIKKGE